MLKIRNLYDENNVLPFRVCQEKTRLKGDRKTLVKRALRHPGIPCVTRDFSQNVTHDKGVIKLHITDLWETMAVLDDGRRRRLGASRCRGDDGGQWAKEGAGERDDKWKEGGSRERNWEEMAKGERRRRVLEIITRKIRG